jgi:replicative DNA helicase
MTESLRSRGILERVGGPAYPAELSYRVPTAANAVHYARIVHEKAVLRSIAAVATQIASEAYVVR